ncbi:tetratricopeptide repeat-containing sulfotransferase family protein [Pararhodobacter zhoushanensis]|uniref:Sulfotransferase n=1 Tax=Pararhodobacter zhoushanensis TaxID=2479545 RepID=A0ABT3GTH5_9RHOB|nr:tetratricopeptide repeat-containing sulfotransferase family protein [Pararhodobacter zhoushanensis]MCW1930841.1 sulfotransferase [Pararhodobacter zhoushanensis]
MPPTDREMHDLEALMRAGDFAPAIARTRALIRQFPREPLLHNVLGVALMQDKRADEAPRAFRRALELAPGYGEANHNLIAALIATGALLDAEAPIRAALAQQPDDALMQRNLASVLVLRADWAAAHAAATQALALAPGHAGTLLMLATIQRAQGDLDAALATLATLPANAEALMLTGEIRTTQGDLDAARTSFTAALDADPALGNAWEGLAMITRFAPGDPLIARMQAQHAQATGETRMHLDFALAKALADTGEDAQAFTHLTAANAARCAALPAYSHGQRRKEITRIKALFAPQALARLAEAGDPSSLPVFVIGMPRSGTTLVEQILASHPAVAGAGERPDMMRLGAALLETPRKLDAGFVRDTAAAQLAALRALAPDAQHVTDKMPQNADWVGLILTLFPQARIIRTLRDPRDIALSVYRAHFTDPALNWTCDLDDIASYYAQHCELMAHWQAQFPGAILSCRYEDLVTDTEAETRRLAAHLGLDWDAAMLAPQDTQRVVTTASAAQVRAAISDRSVGGWKRYEAQFDPFNAALARLGQTV